MQPHPKPRRTQPSGLAALLVLALGCAARSTPSSDPKDDPCSDFATDQRRVWSRETAVKVHASIVARYSGDLGVDVADHQAAEVTSTMDRIASDWVMLRRAVCMDHFKRGMGTDAEYQQRATCFDRVLQRQRVALSMIEKGAREGMSQVSAMGEELDRCR